MMTMRRNGDAWAAPVALPYSGEPVFSVDGKRLYFDSPSQLVTGVKCDGPWFIEKQGDHWSEPKDVGLLSRFPELQLVSQLSIARNGTLYFIAHLDGPQLNIGIYRSELVNGEYARPEPLPHCINLPSFRNWTPFIAPTRVTFCFPRTEPEVSTVTAIYMPASGGPMGARPSQSVWASRSIQHSRNGSQPCRRMASTCSSCAGHPIMTRSCTGRGQMPSKL